MAKYSTFKKIDEISAAMLSVIVWGVYEKYYRRHPDAKRPSNGIKNEAGENIRKDILLYCREHYSSRTEGNVEIEQLVIDNIAKSSTKEYTEFGTAELVSQRNSTENGTIKEETAPVTKAPGESTERISLLVEKTKYDNFMNLLPLVYHSIDTPFKFDLPRVQLEALCLYGWDKTYNQLLQVGKHFYFKNDSIRFIPTDLRKVFEEPLRALFTALEHVNAQGGSEKIMKRACKMFSKETELLCESFSEGRYFVRNDYLTELLHLMQDCDVGFGISIPKFNPNWIKQRGTDILALNKKQAEGFLDSNKTPTKNPSPWIRIFLMEGIYDTKKEVYKLSEKEEKIIKSQLEHLVEVYIIFGKAWENVSGSKLDPYDFAIARIDDRPTLMGTQFKGSDESVQGYFYTDESMPQKHFDGHLGLLLTQSNSKYIFKPKLAKNSVVLNQSFGITELRNLTSLLNSIYRKQ